MTFPKIVSKVYLSYQRCVRAMFGMFLAYLEPRKALNKHFHDFWLFFRKSLLKKQLFTVKKDRRACVNQNTGCRLACVCREVTRQRAFESPDLGECFKYPQHVHQTSRKFFTGP